MSDIFPQHAVILKPVWLLLSDSFFFIFGFAKIINLSCSHARIMWFEKVVSRIFLETTKSTILWIIYFFFVSSFTFYWMPVPLLKYLKYFNFQIMLRFRDIEINLFKKLIYKNIQTRWMMYGWAFVPLKLTRLSFTFLSSRCQSGQIVFSVGHTFSSVCLLYVSLRSDIFPWILLLLCVNCDTSTIGETMGTFQLCEVSDKIKQNGKWTDHSTGLSFPNKLWRFKLGVLNNNNNDWKLTKSNSMQWICNLCKNL